ncbi:MAG: ABC transporter ATP-binding protein [Lachnospiraceae bacterium]|nr:ABC transporter ATP-binding protein [Lachnospiraceae bacterium]
MIVGNKNKNTAVSGWDSSRSAVHTAAAGAESAGPAPVLAVQDLRIGFTSDFGERIVTDDLCFQVEAGETLGIVGESGCGKSVTSLAVMGLLGKNGHVRKGSAVFQGKDLLQLTEKELDQIRGKELTMVFQDALAGLDPVFTIGTQMTEPLRIHLGLSRKEAQEHAVELLKRVGVPDAAAAMKKYPSQLSGGMRQRVMIAMALSCHPTLLIADEPTTALDATIQAQIMRLLRKVREEESMSMMLITHDIGVIAQMADRVMVMYAGQIVEEAKVGELFRNPLHPYTKALLASVPSIHDDGQRVLESIPGSVPEDYTEITGCRFAARCRYFRKGSSCDDPQPYKELGEGHRVRCAQCSCYSCC